jgi:hypothetical protein
MEDIKADLAFPDGMFFGVFRIDRINADGADIARYIDTN